MARARGGIGLGAVVVLIAAAACGRVAQPVYIAERTATAIVAEALTQVGGEAAAQAASPTTAASHTPAPTDTPIPTHTPVPPTATPLPPTAAPTTDPQAEGDTASGVPADAAERVAQADAANGQALFTTFQADAGFACSTCHNVANDERLIGPGLLTIASRAETRVAGLDAAQYIYQSIVNPSAYLVESYPDDLMPQNWMEIYSEEQIYDIMAYLFTLGE